MVQTCNRAKDNKWGIRMNMVKLLFVLLFLCTNSNEAFCQSKPKRDKSKDQSTLVAKQSKPTKQRPHKTTNNRKRKPSYKVNAEKPSFATFILVDNAIEVAKSFKYNGGYEYFHVSTDGEDWSYYGSPKWCSVYKEGSTITVKCDANKSHEERKGRVFVNSDSHRAVINITQQAAPNIKASFYGVEITHNNRYSWTNEQYMNINGKVMIAGAKNIKCIMVGTFTDIYNNPIKAESGYYRFTNSFNDISIVEDITPNTDDSQVFNIVLSIPNGVFKQLNKKKTVVLHLNVYCTELSQYVEGASCSLLFRTKNKRGKIKTSNL